MIKFEDKSFFSNKTNEAVINTVLSEPSFELRFKLQELLDERGIGQAPFAKMTGIRRTDIVHYCNNKFRPTVNLSHLFTMMIALRITDINEILEVRVDGSVKEQYSAESADWIATKQLPVSLQALVKENSQFNP